MKKIMIIGAGLLQSFVIKRAKELGYSTVCVDGNPNAVGFQYADDFKVINITDKEACLEYAKEMKIDGILTAATDYGVLTASYIAQKMNLVGNRYEVCEIIKNKYSTRKVLSDNNVDSMTEFYEITNINQIDNILNHIKLPVIVKPCDGSGSRGIKKISDKIDLKEACEDALACSLSKKVLIEQFIEGNEYGVESFVVDGDVNVLCIMNKTMTKDPVYAELGHCSKSGLPKEVEETIKIKVTNTIKALGITTGSVNMDLLVDDKFNIYIIDIGARMGGNLIGSHIVPLSTGIDYIGNMIKLALRENVNLERVVFDKVISTRLLTLTPGKVKNIECIKDIEDLENVEDLILNIKEGSIINEYRSNLDNCGYVVVSDSNYELAKKKALDLKEEIDKRVVKH